MTSNLNLRNFSGKTEIYYLNIYKNHTMNEKHNIYCLYNIKLGMYSTTHTVMVVFRATNGILHCCSTPPHKQYNENTQNTLILYKTLVIFI